MNVKDFIEREQSLFGESFVDINYAIDNVSPFLDKEVLERRKYVIKLPVLKEYITLLQNAETDSNKKKGIFSIFKGDDVLSNLEDYKRNNLDSLNQLTKCSKCKCLNCTAECNFDSCAGCRRNSNIVNCDHSEYNVTFFDDFTLDLTNNNSGKRSKYKVLATIQAPMLDKRYILIENILDKDDKFILYYYPNLSEDEFGEITNPEEFDTVASLYEKANI